MSSLLSQITLKDLVYIITIVSIIAGYIHEQRSLKDKCDRVMSAIFHPQGGLNIINCEQCKLHRDVIFTAIRKGDSSVYELTKEIKNLNENVLKILFHLKIDKK